MSSAKLVNRYLGAFYSGDFDAARRLVVDDFHFKGPFVETTNREAYFIAAAPLARVVRGHRLIRQWEENDQVCSIYDVSLETSVGRGTVTMCEWNTADKDLIRSGRVILDTAEFRALMPPR